MNRQHLHPARPLALAALLATVVACGSDDPAGTAPTSAPAQEPAYELAACMREQGIDGWPDPTIEADGSVLYVGLDEVEATAEEIAAAKAACGETKAEPREVTPAGPAWEEIEAGGDCQCADGSPYSFFARAANEQRVVLFLGGGGACWSAESCAEPELDNEYRTAVEGPSGEGVFDAADERNPLAGYSFVYVPYCTGDVHLGDATTEYSPDLTVQHKGAVNAAAALDYLAATFPDATEVVVIGSSAGAVSASLYSALVSNLLPDARVTVIADSAGGYTDTPELNAIVGGEAWGTANAFPEWSADADHWNAPGFYALAAARDPEITFARYDHTADEDQLAHLALAGVDVGSGGLTAQLDASEAAIEAAGVDLHSYRAPGTDHTGLGNDRFYTEEVDGIALVDWVSDVVDGQPVEDVTV